MRSFTSLVLAASSPSLALALHAPGAAPRPVVTVAAASSPQLPMLSAHSAHRRASALVMEEDVSFPTLEEELASGAITQEEYDQMMAGIDEEEYAVEEATGGEPELSEDAARVLRGMTSVTGVEFAPWMKVDAEAIAQAKKEREMRKARSAANARQSDSMLIDPQAAELGAGGGLKSKVLSEEEVELRWDTQDETGNAGFIVQRRRGGGSNFEDIASYESFSPLRSKGPSGGTYVYLDDSADVGTWVYRILDCDTSGTRSAVCQKLVEVDSQAEQTQTLIVGGLIATLALVCIGAGIFIDPIQTTSKGASFF